MIILYEKEISNQLHDLYLHKYSTNKTKTNSKCKTVLKIKWYTFNCILIKCTHCNINVA